MDGIDLVAQSGCLTALLGPNGAGKTTFISAVATLVKPDSGTLLVGGIDVRGSPPAGAAHPGPGRTVCVGRTGDDRPGKRSA
ncbi:MAG: ATP-binding cassette domain-containing protein [Chitinophagaceae bacterium]